MASAAKIGALMVSLGIDTAQFSAGLKKSQASLASFGKMAGAALKVTALAATAAGAAMGYAVKSAIDHADALSKSAQKAGVTTEALSRLAYAASYSDVSMEGLTGGLQKLSKAMLDATQTPTSAAAAAFKALGISVTDASGKLRGGDAVFADLSDRFSRMQDGATKTALAMQIFGKSGAEMIPLLNGGSAELKRMADEADRLGITLSTKAGKDAERFNDTLSLIGKVLQGVTNKVMEAALPALQSLAQTLASPEIASAAMTLATNIIGALDKVMQVIAAVTNGIADIGKWMDGDGAKAPDGATFRQLYPSAYGKAEGGITKSLDGIAMGGMPNYDYYGSLAGKGGSLNVTKPTALFEPIITGAGNAKKSMIDLTENVGKFTDSSMTMASAVGDSLGGDFSRLADAVLSGNDALSATVDILMDLGKQLVSSAITGFFGNLVSGGLSAGAGLGGGGIGRGVYGGSGGFFPGFPGFEGGGYTGMGSRSGGMDGRGGFPAVLHPNETVIDHTKDGGGDFLSVSVVTEVRNGNLVPIMTQVAGQVAGRTVQQQAPAVVAKARRDKVVG